MSTTPAIPPGYLFSQHSLGTYRRCPRRFLFKYVDRQPWPALEDPEPIAYRLHLERGRIFHYWLARRHLGIDMQPIVDACGDPYLQDWWRALEEFDWDALPTGLREAELPLVVPIGDHRLYARFDFLALDAGGDAIVVDWKTLERVPPERTLRSRMQTRLYLYALVAAGRVLTGSAPVDPDRAAMLYWFANHPGQTALIGYSENDYCRDEEMLRGLVAEIVARPREAFDLTDDLRQCGRCNYATLCHREEAADLPGAADWLDEEIDFAIELQEVHELDF